LKKLPKNLQIIYHRISDKIKQKKLSKNLPKIKRFALKIDLNANIRGKAAD
jgi:hypothetical protein